MNATVNTHIRTSPAERRRIDRVLKTHKTTSNPRAKLADVVVMAFDKLIESDDRFANLRKPAPAPK